MEPRGGGRFALYAMPVDEFIARNADPSWLQQNEMWELMFQNSTDSAPR